jgi:hypothetical protein
MEDGDYLIIPQQGRNGTWFEYNDGSGTTQYPVTTTGIPFIMSSPGDPASPLYAAQIDGSMDSSSSPYAGMGFTFTNPEGPYNAAAYGYTGISFWAKVGAGTASSVRFMVSQSQTTPPSNGGSCATTCYDNYGENLIFTNTWTQYSVNFNQMTQAGWGIPVTFDPTSLMTVQWQVAGRGDL